MKNKNRSHKKRVLKKIPDAFCVKMSLTKGYVVWPGKQQPRGLERPAIGLGLTARQAWGSVELP